MYDYFSRSTKPNLAFCGTTEEPFHWKEHFKGAIYFGFNTNRTNTFDFERWDAYSSINDFMDWYGIQACAMYMVQPQRERLCILEGLENLSVLARNKLLCALRVPLAEEYVFCIVIPPDEFGWAMQLFKQRNYGVFFDHTCNKSLAKQFDTELQEIKLLIPNEGSYDTIWRK